MTEKEKIVCKVYSTMTYLSVGAICRHLLAYHGGLMEKIFSKVYSTITYFSVGAISMAV
jgi:hypothetical protein